MYLQNYWPRKRCLDKSLTGPVLEDFLTGDMVNGPKHRFNINEGAFTILSDHCEGIFSRFVNTLTTDDKYSIISRDNWMPTIHMHLSQKQNIFSQFSSVFFEFALNFQHFQNKMTLIADVFWKLPTTKDVLR